MNLLYFTLLFPLMGFLFLAFSYGRWSEIITAIVGVGSIGMSVLTAFWVVLHFLIISKNDTFVYTQSLWEWITVCDFQIPIRLSLDGLSLTMLSLITGIGFLIHLYSSWYMRGREGYSRFFAYTNLFIASMLLLVLADNFLVMFFGWEIVGFCSYLLIGFYFNEPKNGIAAIKAFIVTRVGDILLAFSLFILYKQFGTLNFHELILLAQQKKIEGCSVNIILALLMLVGGAVGKSAQLPLHTWLSDAMVGPTPVSALIHAATMVTAGVYLIARTHSLFLIAPNVLHLVGSIGAVTLVLASFTAMVQSNIKRILAYSTISQIGYMFLALGVEAWNAAILHLIIHAFFKALLFLSSGSIIISCNHEQNIFKMGGLRHSIPLIYVCFLVGSASLSALPIITAGFYSKDEILWNVLISGHQILMIFGVIGALFTSLYTFRMIFIIFHGTNKIKIQIPNSLCHDIPLVVLLILSTFIGAFITPPLNGVFPVKILNNDGKIFLDIILGIITIIGIWFASNIWLKSPHRLVYYIAKNSIGGHFLAFWCNKSWGFDWLYEKVLVKPYLSIASLLAHDPLNAIMSIPVMLTCAVERILLRLENGQLRWYVASVGIGAIIIEIILLFV